MTDGRRSAKNSAPGRDASRPGAQRPRRPRPAAASGAPRPASEPKPATSTKPGRALNLTHRAIALMVVVAMLAVSYVRGLTVYLSQRSDIATATQQIADRQADVSRLSDELNRWNDPDYVKTQARDRLGWVVPGETGYRVIGLDGKVVSGQVGSIAGRTDPENQTWYERLWGTVQAADQPVVTQTAQPSAEQTVTVPTATPR